MIPKITPQGVHYINEEQAEKIPVHKKVIETYDAFIVVHEKQLEIQDKFIEKLQKEKRILGVTLFVTSILLFIRGCYDLFF